MSYDLAAKWKSLMGRSTKGQFRGLGVSIEGYEGNCVVGLSRDDKPILLIGASKFKDGFQLKLSSLDIGVEDFHSTDFEPGRYYHLSLGGTTESFYYSGFLGLCNEIVDGLSQVKGDPSVHIEKVFNEWRKFWAPYKEEEVDRYWLLGLLGELLVLEELRGVTPMALEFWIGIRKAPKDFLINGKLGLEVKSTLKQKADIKVNGVDQLSLGDLEELYIFLNYFSASDKAGALNLPDLVKRVSSLMETQGEIDKFWKLLESAGYSRMGEVAYGKHTFEFLKRSVFEVDSAFNSLNKYLVGEPLPSEISKVSYSLEIKEKDINEEGFLEKTYNRFKV